MLFTTIMLLPLALAHPHLAPAPRRHHARAAAAAAAEVTNRPLVERAGAAIGNDTRDEISAWRHSQEVLTSSSAVVTSASGIQGVGTALTAVNSDSASEAPSSAVQTSASEQQVTESVVQESVVETVTSESAPTSSAAPAEAAAASPSPSSAVESSAEIASSSATSLQSSVTHTTVVTASRSSTVVRVTASSSASASAAASKNEPETIAGLNKTTFIIIIVVASVVALMAAGWTVFRKWKLSPSRRFDEKMRPIDFSPDNGTGDLYTEKSHHRSSSNSSAAMHRQELVAELDSKHVEGVPDHDFTAGGHSNMAGAGAYDDNVYNSDPYSHAEAYEYDAAYQYDQDPRGYAHDQPTQDTGYADLHRGNSIGSGSGHGHGHGQQYPVESFPVPDHYLNRPLSGDAPYGTSHRY